MPRYNEIHGVYNLGFLKHQVCVTPHENNKCLGVQTAHLMQFLSALLLRLFGNGARIENADCCLGRSLYAFTSMRFKLSLVCGRLRVIELASQGVVEYRLHKATISGAQRRLENSPIHTLIKAIRVSPSWCKPPLSLTGNELLRVPLPQSLHDS